MKCQQNSDMLTTSWNLPAVVRTWPEFLFHCLCYRRSTSCQSLSAGHTHIQCIHCSLFSTSYGSFKSLHWAERKGSDVLWVLYCAYLCIVCVRVLSVYCMRAAAYNTVEASKGLQATVDVVLMYATSLSLNVDTDSLLALEENRLKC